MPSRPGRLSRPRGAANTRISVDLDHRPATTLGDLGEFPDLVLNWFLYELDSMPLQCCSLTSSSEWFAIGWMRRRRFEQTSNSQLLAWCGPLRRSQVVSSPRTFDLVASVSASAFNPAEETHDARVRTGPKSVRRCVAESQERPRGAAGRQSTTGLTSTFRLSTLLLFDDDE